ncbi:MAG: hypothetical protein LAT84_08995 [Balneolia bacterium]|nr:hypothetical protein [Balneolia bacterium]
MIFPMFVMIRIVRSGIYHIATKTIMLIPKSHKSWSAVVTNNLLHLHNSSSVLTSPSSGRP